jgi:perosamine synthetase
MNYRIPVSAPAFHGKEREYLLDSFDSTWISSNGPYLQKFEEAFASFCHARHAISCSNGTVALHLSLLGAGVGPGDEVIVPDITFIATGNAAVYCGAKPVFADVDPATWNLDPEAVKKAIGPRTKAIIAVHLYGHPADLEPLSAIAREHGLALIEDAAEAHGAEYKGRRVGAIGDIGTFSFYGNKIVTTGEGGMVVTNNDDLAVKIFQMKGQGQDFKKRYWFPILGYNYRLTNMQAAIGLAQLECIDWHLGERRRVANSYLRLLKDCPFITLPVEKPWAKHAYWMFGVMLNRNARCHRDTVMKRLEEMGIETRPFFYPLHTQPVYKDLKSKNDCPVADLVASSGLCLPTWAGLGEEQIAEVSSTLKKILADA